MTSSDIRERETKYRAAIETSGDGFCISDMAGRFLEFNDAYVNLTGYSREELLNMSIPDIEAQQTAAEIAATLEKARCEGHANFETKHRSKDGRVRPVEVNLSYWPIAGGRMFVFLRDITERKQAEMALRDREDMLRFSLDAAGIGFWELDLLNHTARRSLLHDQIFGYRELLPQWTYEMFLEHVFPEDRLEVDRKFQEALKAPHDWSFECRIRRVDKAVRWIWAKGRSRFNDQGMPVRMLGLVSDITERKQAEEALSRASLYTRSLIEASLDALVTISPDGKIMDVNKATEEATGVMREELIGRDFSDYFTEPDKARSGYQQVLAEGFVRDYPLALRHTSGRLMDVLYNATIYKNEAGEAEGVFAAARDVTERKRLEEARSQLAFIVESSDDEIISKTLDGIITSWNLGAKRIYGYSAAEAIGKPISILVPPNRPDEVPQILEKIKRGESVDHYETVRLRKDGSLIDVSLTISPIKNTAGELVGAATIGRDITRNKQMEEQLRLASTYARSLIEASLDPLVTISPDGKIMDVNKATEEATGVMREELIGRDFSDYFTEPDKARSGYRQAFSQGMVRDYPLAIRHFSGRVTDVIYNASIYTNKRGEVQGVFAAARDITARKRAEEALRESEERFRLAFENANIGMALVGIDGRYLRVNDALSEMFGYLREELEKMGVRDLTYPDDLQLSKDFRLQTLRGEIGNAQFEKRKVHRNGTIVWVQIASSLVRDSQDKPLYFISQVQDITARKKAEEELRRVLAGLERRVQERTEELRQTVARLQQEVTERQRAEEALKESEAKLRHLARHLLFLQEEERQALSWDLQESLAQSIAVLKMDLRTFEQKLPTRNKALREEYRQTLKQIDGIVENLRRRAAELSPQMLTDLGLTVVLKSLCESYDIKCLFYLDDLSECFSLEDQFSIYRVFQEAMNNVSRHSQASLVTLFAKKQDDRVEFLVEDNGQGFEVGKMEDLEAGRRSIGLAAMSERVRSLGGTFKIESQPGVGTRVFFNIPRIRK